MRQPQLHILLIFIIGLTISCTSDDDTKPEVRVETKKLSKVTTYNRFYEFHYEGDEFKEMHHYFDTLPKPTHFTTLVRNEANQITEMITRPRAITASGLHSGSGHYYLQYDSLGRLNGCLYEGKSAEWNTNWSSKKSSQIIYNAEGTISQVIDTLWYFRATTMTVTKNKEESKYDENGNLSKWTRTLYHAADTSSYCTNKIIHDDKKTPVSSLPIRILLGETFSKNNITSTQQVSECADNNEDVNLHREITYDISDYPIKIEYFDSGGLLTTTFYEYVE